MKKTAHSDTKSYLTKKMADTTTAISDELRQLRWDAIDPHETLADALHLSTRTPEFKDRVYELLYGLAGSTGKVVRSSTAADALIYVSYCLNQQECNVVLVAAEALAVAEYACTFLSKMYPARKWRLLPVAYAELWEAVLSLDIGADTLPPFGTEGANDVVEEFRATHASAFRNKEPAGALDAFRPLVSAESISSERDAQILYAHQSAHLIMLDTPSREEYYKALMLLPAVRRWALLGEEVAWNACAATMMAAGCHCVFCTWESAGTWSPPEAVPAAKPPAIAAVIYDFRNSETEKLQQKKKKRKREWCARVSTKQTRSETRMVNAKLNIQHTHAVCMFTHPTPSWYRTYASMCKPAFVSATSKKARLRAHKSVDIVDYIKHAVDNVRLERAAAYVTSFRKELCGKRLLLLTSCRRLATLALRALDEPAFAGANLHKDSAVVYMGPDKQKPSATSKFHDHDCVLLLDPWAIGYRPDQWLCGIFSKKVHFVWILARHTPELTFYSKLRIYHEDTAEHLSSSTIPTSITPRTLFRLSAAAYTVDVMAANTAIVSQFLDTEQDPRLGKRRFVSFENMLIVERELATRKNVVRYALYNRDAGTLLSARRALPSLVFVDMLEMVDQAIAQLEEKKTRTLAVLFAQLAEKSAAYLNVSAGKVVRRHKKARTRSGQKEVKRRAAKQDAYMDYDALLHRIRTIERAMISSKDVAAHIGDVCLERSTASTQYEGSSDNERDLLRFDVDIVWRVCVDKNLRLPSFVCDVDYQLRYAQLVDAADPHKTALAMACCYLSHMACYEPMNRKEDGLSLLVDNGLFIGAYPIKEGVRRAHDFLRAACPGLLSLRYVPSNTLQAWNDLFSGRMATDMYVPEWSQITEYNA